jgi:Ran GTPase-activating protein (RanGAP) involved in mRNA processing and transport
MTGPPGNDDSLPAQDQPTPPTAWPDIPAAIRTQIEARLAAFRPAPDGPGSLDLSKCGITPDVGGVLVKEKLSPLAGLNALHISGNRVGDAGAQAIAQHLTALQSLNIRDNRVGDAGAQAIAQHLTALQSLDISFNRVGEAGAQAIAQHLTALQSLHIIGSRVGEAGAQAIAQHLTALQSLHISGNDIGKAGAQAIAQHLTALQSLGISGNRLGDAEAQAIAQRLTALQSLSISFNDVGEAGAQAIAQRLTALKLLDIRDNRVGEAGAQAIAQHLTVLKFLDISGNDIGEVGAQAIAQHLTALKSLNIGHNPDITSIDGFAARVLPHGPLAVLRVLGCEGIQRHYGLDESVLEIADARQLIEEIAKARGSGRVPLPMLKAMLLGQGRIGKTRLRHRLMRQPPPDQTESTHSFEITTLPERFTSGSQGDIQLRLFDVGGQEALHAAHRLFLGSERNFYIIMCNGTASPAEARLPYWLRMVAQYAPQAPVIVVVSWGDQPAHAEWAAWGPEHRLCEELELKTRWVRGYVDRPPGAETPALFEECKFTEVEQAIRATVGDLADAVSRRYDPGFLKLVKWLGAKRIEEVPAELRRFRLFKRRLDVEKQFIPACKAVGADTVGTAMLWRNILANLGLGCWFGNLPEAQERANALVGRELFHPDWIKQPMYRLIRDHPRSDNLKLPSSMTTPAELRAMLSEANLSIPEQDALLAILATTRMLFDVKDAGGLPKAYLLADWLREDSRPPDLHGGWTTVDSPSSFAFIGDAYLPRLIGELWSNVDDQNKDAWRNWAVFTVGDDAGKQRVLVKVDINAATVTYRVPQGQRPEAVEPIRKKFEELLERDQVEVLGRTVREGSAGHPVLRPQDEDKAPAPDKFTIVLDKAPHDPLPGPNPPPMWKAWISATLEDHGWILAVAALAGLVALLVCFPVWGCYAFIPAVAVAVAAAVIALGLRAYFRHRLVNWTHVCMSTFLAMSAGGVIGSTIGLQDEFTFGAHKLTIGVNQSTGAVWAGLVGAGFFGLLQCWREHKAQGAK